LSPEKTLSPINGEVARVLFSKSCAKIEETSKKEVIHKKIGFFIIFIT
jgi:hypothetical protein